MQWLISRQRRIEDVAEVNEAIGIRKAGASFLILTSHLFRPEGSIEDALHAAWERPKSKDHVKAILSLACQFNRAMRNLRSILVFHPALWCLLALQTIVIAIWIAIDPRISFGLDNIDEVSFALIACLLVASGISYRFPTERRPPIAERARVLAVGLIFLVVTFVGIRLLNYLSMSLAFPLADDVLDSWDRALGIDWYAYASGLSQYPQILPFIELPYTLTIGAVSVVYTALTLLGKLERAKEFVTILFAAALLTVCVSTFFPAEAAMVRHGDDHLVASFGPSAGVYHIEVMRILRESKEIVLSFAHLPGLATFPSFHTIVGLLIVYACRGNIITLVLAGIWTGAMLLATPIYGGHYFIDIIAGFVVTVALATAYAAIETTILATPRMAATEALP